MSIKSSNINQIVFLLFVVVLVSCNKYKPDPLKDELSYLVGTWKWDSTFHRYNWCTGSVVEETIFPSEYSNNFSLVFEEDGCLLFYANDSVLDKSGLTIDTYFKEDGVENVSFYLNGDENKQFFMVGTETSSNVSKFPYEEYDSGCEYYFNYFSKE